MLKQLSSGENVRNWEAITGGRTVSNITIDEETRDIVITFGSGLTKNSNLLLKLA